MNLPAPVSESSLSMALPAALDGRDGTNRGRNGYRRIAADTDLEAARLWLADYMHSAHARAVIVSMARMIGTTGTPWASNEPRKSS
jgi:hypothetical protein